MPDTQTKTTWHPSTLLKAIDELLGLNIQAETALMKGVEGEALTTVDRESIKHYEEGLQKILDIIAPSAMEVRNTEILLNDQYSRTLYAYNWPNYIFPN